MMKVSFKLIFAALAATAALTGCTKEPTPGQTDQTPASPAAEGTRVITVSFAPQTKTSFSETAGGIEPYFVQGDKIVLCSDIENPTDDNTETCTVTEQCTITTKLTGALTAFYPADYVEKGEKLGLCIPANQSGEFKDANFVATIIADGATSATFYNVIALFRITPPTGTKKLTVKSLCEIGSDGQRSGDRRSINDEGETDQKRCSVVVGDGTTNIESPCYVALSPGVNLSDLSFEATSDAEGTTGFIKGIPASVIAAAAGTDVAVGFAEYDEKNEVKSAKAYTIDDSNWHPYVTVAGRKWATMNIGAESPTDVGEYFMWGEVSGHKYVSEAWTNFPADKPADSRYTDTWDNTKGFAWDNTPYCDGEEHFTKYVLETEKTEYGKDGFFDGKTTLDLVDDAAYVNWGGAWRMPTSTEYGGLIEYWDENVSGCIQIGEDLKFPELSCGQGLTFNNYTVYWTSSGHGQQPNYFGYYTDGPGLSSTNWDDRFYGGAIRAIVDDPDFIATED